MNREDHIAMGHRALKLASEQLLFALEHIREAGLNVTCGHIRNAADSVLTARHQVMSGSHAAERHQREVDGHEE